MTSCAATIVALSSCDVMKSNPIEFLVSLLHFGFLSFYFIKSMCAFIASISWSTFMTAMSLFVTAVMLSMIVHTRFM